jgi:hypothetical protein
MESLTPSHSIEKSPLKDVTNSTPTHLIVGSARKSAKSALRGKHSNPESVPRRSTRLNPLKEERSDQNGVENGLLSCSPRKTRSRKRATPVEEGSVVTRRRRSKKETEEENVMSPSSRRRSLSTVCSSPLACKNSHQQMPMTLPDISINYADSRAQMPVISEIELSDGSDLQGVY